MIGARMVHQDILGKERYIQFVEEHWIDLPPIIGVFILVAGIFWYVRLLLKAEKQS